MAVHRTLMVLAARSWCKPLTGCVSRPSLGRHLSTSPGRLGHGQGSWSQLLTNSCLIVCNGPSQIQKFPRCLHVTSSHNHTLWGLWGRCPPRHLVL